ncbi:hypothetical protein LTR97_006164 [Elasticomyces elasticus]|uniref:Uncharacterized protein n=1 Tax=Elasticomyces elasticus TaxID=574655 RepID=A0AAN7VRQ1_9PEZI|nr:hypothetical protein LTR97_006164 [Elasticomyces elasticus]
MDSDIPGPSTQANSAIETVTADAEPEFESSDATAFAIGMIFLFCLFAIGAKVICWGNSVIAKGNERSALERAQNTQQEAQERQKRARTASQQRGQVLAAYLPEPAASLFLSGSHTHLTVVCNNKERYWADGHTCEPPEFLAKAYDKTFKELRVVLQGDEGRIVVAVLDYFRKLCKTHDLDFDPTLLHVRLYVYAELADLHITDLTNHPLVKAALKNFVDVCKHSWSTPAFAQAVQEIYQHPANFTKGLRTAAADITAKHGDVLLAPGTEHHDFKAVASSTPHFITEVLAARTRAAANGRGKSSR